MHYYKLTPTAVRRLHENSDWWVYAIDRRPAGGVLAGLCQEVPVATSQHCHYHNRVVALKVPDDLATMFADEVDQTYVTPVNLPAFLSYMADHGYQDADMSHVDATGVWIVDASNRGVVIKPRGGPKLSRPAATPAAPAAHTTTVSRYARRPVRSTGIVNPNPGRKKGPPKNMPKKK